MRNHARHRVGGGAAAFRADKVTVNGVPQADQTADKSRPDVSSTTEYQDYGPNHGFDFTAVALGGQQICVTAVNVGAGTNTDLGCRTA